MYWVVPRYVFFQLFQQNNIYLYNNVRSYFSIPVNAIISLFNVNSSQDVQDNQGPLWVDEEGDDEGHLWYQLVYQLVNPIGTMNEINAFDGHEDEATNSNQDAADVSEFLTV